MKSHWIDYRGKRIFFADYSGFGNDTAGLQQELDEAVEVLAREPDKSVLVLSNFENTVTTVTNLNAVRHSIQPANKAVIKRAILGVGGVRRMFLTTFSNVLGDTDVAAFDTQEQALVWLTKE
ncbi:MAG TPA: hypothetical protein VMC09_08520 [Anaerolineales bacterium]|nr:hypothetical protein [Anaerolineales bacterium]